jgi:hypothetical protein
MAHNSIRTQVEVKMFHSVTTIMSNLMDGMREGNSNRIWRTWSFQTFQAVTMNSQDKDTTNKETIDNNMNMDL